MPGSDASAATERKAIVPDEAAALRSQAYATFAAAFEYPDAAMLTALRSGEFAATLEHTLTRIDPTLGDLLDRAALRSVPDSDEELLAEYTRLFISGREGPACVLEEGAHRGAELPAMEEVLRYYHLFGLALPLDRQVPPDHLKTELEFLHYLAYQESRAMAEGCDLEGLVRAQRDFIERHPGGWVPLLRERLTSGRTMPFLQELARMLEHFLASDVRTLSDRIGTSN